MTVEMRMNTSSKVPTNAATLLEVFILSSTISHATWMPIIADPTLAPQIYSRVNRKGDSSHINRGNLTRTRPDNVIVASIQENISVIPREEEAIGQHVKTNGKPQGISHSTRIPIVDSTHVEQIHYNVKWQAFQKDL